MMSLILGFLGGWWKQIAFAVIVVSIYAYIGILRHERDSAKIERDQVKAENASLVAQADDWKKMVDYQNAKIAQMDKAFHLAQVRMVHAQALARQISLDTETKISHIRHYYETIPDSDDCKVIKQILDADAPTVH